MLVSLLSIVSATTNEQYDELLRPIQSIYDFVKYAVTVIAGLVLIFAGYTFITSGSDPKKKDTAKNMIMYVVIGLAIIWAAPLIVKLVLGA
jgi:membrane-bound acyltransferase YfiQ involved in biofilm formation